MRKRPETPYEDAGGQTKESYLKKLSVGIEIIKALRYSTQPQSIEDLARIVNKDKLEIVNKDEKRRPVNKSSLYRNIPLLISEGLLKEEPPGARAMSCFDYLNGHLWSCAIAQFGSL